MSEKLLKQVAEEFALAMNESLPIPEQCQHQFSEEFERKMQRLLSAVPMCFSQFKNCENHNVIILIIVIALISPVQAVRMQNIC